MARRTPKSRPLWPMALAQRRLGASARRVRRLLIVAAIIAALVALDRLGWADAPRGDLRRYDGRTFLVVRVVDGDTLDVSAPDGEKLTTRVRLWGIDAPELAKPWEPADASEPGAEAAKLALAEWTQMRPVSLELVPHRVRDDFGRLLAYVYDAQGQRVNDRLVREGLAPADGRWPHPHVAAYELLDEAARRSKRGVWADK